MKNFFLFLILITAGCATMSVAGRGFDSTQSLCADGAIVNIDYHGCKKLHTFQVPGTNTLRVHCEIRSEVNQWTSNTFYFIPKGDRFFRPDLFLICSDPMVDVVFIENPLIYPDTKSSPVQKSHPKIIQDQTSENDD